MASVRYEDLVVLVVEDEINTRNLIKAMLRQFGVRSIAEAGDGKAGLSEVIRTRPHLVLCDVHMEPMNGLDFLKTLRAVKMEKVAKTPVVFLTADAKKDTVIFTRDHKSTAIW
ncbi:MAG: response regulator [Alphaproteobacteria bacterium]|nr:response regulator [Alphaproteobacteria bacterium]